MYSQQQKFDQVYTLVHDGKNVLITRRVIIRTYHNGFYDAPFPAKYPGQWTLPGGKRSESTNSTTEACLKEFRNETGYNLKGNETQTCFQRTDYSMLIIELSPEELKALAVQVNNNLNGLGSYIYKQWKNNTTCTAFHKLFSAYQGAVAELLQDDELMFCEVVPVETAIQRFGSEEKLSEYELQMWLDATAESKKWTPTGTKVDKRYLFLRSKLQTEKRWYVRDWFVKELCNLKK